MRCGSNSQEELTQLTMDWRSSLVRYVSKCSPALVALGFQTKQTVYCVHTENNDHPFNAVTTGRSPFFAVGIASGLDNVAPVDLMNRRVQPVPPSDSAKFYSQHDPRFHSASLSQSSRSGNPNPPQGRSTANKKSAGVRLDLTVQQDVKDWLISNLELSKVRDPANSKKLKNVGSLFDHIFERNGHLSWDASCTLVLFHVPPTT